MYCTKESSSFSSNITKFNSRIACSCDLKRNPSFNEKKCIQTHAFFQFLHFWVVYHESCNIKATCVLIWTIRFKFVANYSQKNNIYSKDYVTHKHSKLFNQYSHEWMRKTVNILSSTASLEFILCDIFGSSI